MDFSLDVRQAVRSMRRRRTLTIATVVILGLGIGSAATMYAVVDQVLLRPLPVRDQGRLVVAWGAFQTSSFDHVPLSYTDMSSIRGRSHVFERIAGLDYNGGWQTVGRVGGEAVPLRLGVVAGELFATLGISPKLGRVLDAGDDRVGAAPVAVISEGLWRRRFGGDSAILGKPLPIWTSVYTIVGILPSGFELPAGSEAWITLGAVRPDVVTDPEYGTLDLVGRLRPGYTPADAKAELDRLFRVISASAWATDSRLVPVVRSLHEVVVGRVRPALLVLWSAAILVFLVAALNLGGLLLVRSLERQQEFALRRALGASRLALIRQVTIEGGLGVALGGLLGIGVSWGALRLVPALAPADLPRIEHLGLDPGVVLVSLGLSALAVVIAGLVPALSISDSGLSHPRGRVSGTAEKPSRFPARSVTVAAQVALAVVTVATAILLIRTLSHLQHLEPGFEPRNLALFQVTSFSPKIDNAKQVVPLMEQVLARVKSAPGVEHATVVLGSPLSGTGGWDFGFFAEGQTAAEAATNPYLNYEAVTPEYFSTFRTPILRGRAFTGADRAGAPLVVIIGRLLAGRMWPGQDPIGKRIRWADSGSVDQWRTVVGVASDTRYRDLIQLRPSVYVPLSQQEFAPAFLVVRSSLPLGALFATLQRQVRAFDRDLDVVNAASMPALLARPLAQPRFNAAVLLAFAAIAVLLAVIGLYALVSFIVAQRTREVGIRLAVGAQPRQIVALILKRGLGPVAVGCGLGVAGVLVAGRLLSAVLFGVTARDPTAIGAAVVGFTLIAVIAALVPARRAARSDPSAALRLE